jgi:hypothetical protein
MLSWLYLDTNERKIDMFDILKTFWAQSKENFMFLWAKPTAFVEQDPKLSEDGYWAFEMYTPEWIDEYGDTVKPIHTCFIEPHEGTWFEVLDKILDAMEAHYGYNIKEQVYYSVTFPLNKEGEAGYGRSLNDDILQKLLLAYPEVYEIDRSFDWKPL